MTTGARRRPRFMFRLYVAGSSQNSLQAVGNLNALCREHLAGLHEIEVVDVFKQPMRALEDGIMMTPTLVRLAPNPVRMIVGTLGRRDTVLQALGIESPAA
jgi:circadian clock protein KaiB